MHSFFFLTSGGSGGADTLAAEKGKTNKQTIHVKIENKTIKF